MSSPDRGSRKPAAAPKKAKAAPAGRKASSGAAAKTASHNPSPQEKADFVKALSKGYAPNSAAAKKVNAKKKGAAEPQAKVEVLRRIPAPKAVVNTPEDAEALKRAAMIEKALSDGQLDKLQPHAQQALIGALCRLYAANTEAGNRYGILGQRSPVTATDVMVTCGALLKAVDLQVFELGMWQSWSST